MGYGVYWVERHERWEGYMVPAICDWPDCTKSLDRGLGRRCESHDSWDDDDDESCFEEDGCDLTFCEDHLYRVAEHTGIKPEPDTAAWLDWILTDESWVEWRETYPEKAAAYRKRLEE